MPYVVTQSCAADASCVLACPVNCIHPAPGEPGYGSAEMLFVDADTCVDCGACTTACPVSAIKPDWALEPAEAPFVDAAAAYYAAAPHHDRRPLAQVAAPRSSSSERARIAVVGAGPAALYAADELLRVPGLTVDVIDRESAPHGLVRWGVAPDHRRTRGITALFADIEAQPGFDYLLGLDVGVDVTHEELAGHYDAVVYATGATAEPSWDVPGADLSVSALDVVGWYNGHPAHRQPPPGLDAERAVVVGTGNVALDIARILTTDPDRLVETDIAADALAALRQGSLREVVVLGRHGPSGAACTLPEIVGLAGLAEERGIDVVVEPGDPHWRPTTQADQILAALTARPTTPGRSRIVLRFHAAPVRLIGSGKVEAVEVARTVAGPDGGIQITDERDVVETGLVVRSLGHRVRPPANLPVDPRSGGVLHERGRVTQGTYVAGWLKRGAHGFIGTNKQCAKETVGSLLDDLDGGLLSPPAHTREDFLALVHDRRSGLLDAHAWRVASGSRDQDHAGPRIRRHGSPTSDSRVSDWRFGGVGEVVGRR